MASRLSGAEVGHAANLHLDGDANSARQRMPTLDKVGRWTGTTNSLAGKATMARDSSVGLLGASHPIAPTEIAKRLVEESQKLVDDLLEFVEQSSTTIPMNNVLRRAATLRSAPSHTTSRTHWHRRQPCYRVCRWRSNRPWSRTSQGTRRCSHSPCLLRCCLHAIASFESGGVLAYACASSQVLMLFDQPT